MKNKVFLAPHTQTQGCEQEYQKIDTHHAMIKLDRGIILTTGKRQMREWDGRIGAIFFKAYIWSVSYKKHLGKTESIVKCLKLETHQKNSRIQNI